MQQQVVTYTAQELSDLARLVSEFANHLDELKLDTRVKQRAKAQLATLEAQLSDQPDPVVVRQVGQRPGSGHARRRQGLRSKGVGPRSA
jgi:hypothetical protein